MSATRSRTALCSRPTASNQPGFSSKLGVFARRHRARVEPQRALPAGFRAVDGAALEKRSMERAAPCAARALHLLARPMDRVVAAVGFRAALAPDSGGWPARARTGARRRATDPCPDRRRGSSAPSRGRRRPSGDAGREAAGDVEVVELRREAEDRLAVGGDGDGAVDTGLNADLVQDRQAFGGADQDRLEAIHVLRKQLAAPLEGNAFGPAGRRPFLPAADGERRTSGFR